MSEPLQEYLLNNLDEHLNDLDFDDEEEREDFKTLMIKQINEGSDMIEICSLMEVPKSKLLEYYTEEFIKQSMMKIYGSEEYEF
jgi:hypothetical protein